MADPDVRDFLRAWGLEEYIEEFQRQSIDVGALAVLNEEHLKLLVPSIGHRAKLSANINEWKNILKCVNASPALGPIYVAWSGGTPLLYLSHQLLQWVLRARSLSGRSIVPIEPLHGKKGSVKTAELEKALQKREAGDCPAPSLSLRGMKVVARPKASPDYAKVGEVKFVAELPAPKPFPAERRLCKIKCVNGKWVGPLCQQDPDDQSAQRFQPLLRSCRIERRPHNLVITYKNITITSNNQTFPHGSWVEARCKEPLGLYKLHGASRLTCQNGQWNYSLPACIPTTLLTNYTEDSPPTILVRLPTGSASAEPNGVLAVVPDSILHLECLFSRQIGNPEWSWTSRYRNYLTGWAIAPEERGWKYRLSIYYTKSQDSGVFTCSTPRGLTNSLNILVTDVECPRLREGDGLVLRSEGNKLGQSVHFHCPTGYRLVGTANLTCRASGRWSGQTPSCEPILCPRLQPQDPRLSLSPHNNTFGSRVVFSCPWGYRLVGSPGLECGLDSQWSAEPPVCSAVRCPPPQTPPEGRLVEDESGGEYGVGSVIQFSCKPGHTLVGEGSIVCTESGVWSHPPPLCRVHCDYPGEPANGRIVPLKFTYEPGDRLKVTCHPGYVTRLEAKPFCKSDGNWSQPVPECRNYKDI